MNMDNDRKLDATLAKLPRAIEPPRDLWPGIEVRILQRPTRSWTFGLASAAVAMVAVAIVWTALSVHTPAPGVDTAVLVPRTQPTAAEPPELQAQFSAQLASNTGLPAPARGALVDNLRLIHDAIVRTQAAVKKYPSDVNLQSLLLDLYQQEARLLSEAQQAQIQTTVRTTI